ncbi:MAG TPA: hypothetical protein VGK16_02725 [Candidatus Limnocylindrales bacterium]
MTTPDDSATAPVDLAPPAPPPAPGAAPTATDARAWAAPPPSTGGAPAATSDPAPAAAPWDAAREARRDNQPALVFGVLLLVIGGILLVTRVADIALGADAWPLWIVVPGLAMLIASFAIPPRGGLGLAIPGAIVTTVGLILWAQQTYDAYGTWAYAWALVAPTAPGVGTLLYGAVRGDGELVRDGLRMTAIGLALFAVFALFFEGVLGLSGTPVANLDQVLPYAVIGLGLLFVGLSMFGGSGRERRERRRERRAR